MILFLGGRIAFRLDEQHSLLGSFHFVKATHSYNTSWPLATRFLYTSTFLYGLGAYEHVVLAPSTIWACTDLMSHTLDGISIEYRYWAGSSVVSHRRLKEDVDASTPVIRALPASAHRNQTPSNQEYDNSLAGHVVRWKSDGMQENKRDPGVIQGR
ncbi:hypothetical protein GALMADRAFT_145465 [Galerina marginata CBS 339.88]|uniref:Uncharacterized protein n=1 Tax=Galerina marginata (strain CBS 339.88) TaxID=685588 RepID=A0A067SP08_GALM3|nr:hypothetical protein GALMADRAFT_145465 [Galerina marginata CBS 339.88]